MVTTAKVSCFRVRRVQALFFGVFPGARLSVYTISHGPFREGSWDPWHILATWRRGMGIFWLQILVGWYRDLYPGPPACESWVIAIITLRGPQNYLLLNNSKNLLQTLAKAPWFWETKRETGRSGSYCRTVEFADGQSMGCQTSSTTVCKWQCWVEWSKLTGSSTSAWGPCCLRQTLQHTLVHIIRAIIDTALFYSSISFQMHATKLTLQRQFQHGPKLPASPLQEILL